MSIASDVIELVKYIAEMAREGLDDSEIQERLEHPSSVGADIISKIEARKEAGSAYVGRKR